MFSAEVSSKKKKSVAMFWRGLHVTMTRQRGFGRVLVCFWISKELRSWAPIGPPRVREQFLNKISEKHQILFWRIPLLSDVQSA